MPITSRIQLLWMQANHPEMAKRWLEHTPNVSSLPWRVSKKPKRVDSAEKQALEEYLEPDPAPFGLAALLEKDGSWGGFGRLISSWLARAPRAAGQVARAEAPVAAQAVRAVPRVVPPAALPAAPPGMRPSPYAGRVLQQRALPGEGVSGNAVGQTQSYVPPGPPAVPVPRVVPAGLPAPPVTAPAAPALRRSSLRSIPETAPSPPGAPVTPAGAAPTSASPPAPWHSFFTQPNVASGRTGQYLNYAQPAPPSVRPNTWTNLPGRALHQTWHQGGNLLRSPLETLLHWARVPFTRNSAGHANSLHRALFQDASSSWGRGVQNILRPLVRGADTAASVGSGSIVPGLIASPNPGRALLASMAMMPLRHGMNAAAGRPPLASEGDAEGLADSLTGYRHGVGLYRDVVARPWQDLTNAGILPESWRPGELGSSPWAPQPNAVQPQVGMHQYHSLYRPWEGLQHSWQAVQGAGRSLWDAAQGRPERLNSVLGNTVVGLGSPIEAAGNLLSRSENNSTPEQANALSVQLGQLEQQIQEVRRTGGNAQPLEQQRVDLLGQMASLGAGPVGSWRQWSQEQGQTASVRDLIRSLSPQSSAQQVEDARIAYQNQPGGLQDLQGQVARRWPQLSQRPQNVSGWLQQTLTPPSGDRPWAQTARQVQQVLQGIPALSQVEEQLLANPSEEGYQRFLSQGRGLLEQAALAEQALTRPTSVGDLRTLTAPVSQLRQGLTQLLTRAGQPLPPVVEAQLQGAPRPPGAQPPAAPPTNQAPPPGVQQRPPTGGAAQPPSPVVPQPQQSFLQGLTPTQQNMLWLGLGAGALGLMGGAGGWGGESSSWLWPLISLLGLGAGGYGLTGGNFYRLGDPQFWSRLMQGRSATDPYNTYERTKRMLPILTQGGQANKSITNLLGQLQHYGTGMTGGFAHQRLGDELTRYGLPAEQSSQTASDLLTLSQQGRLERPIAERLTGAVLPLLQQAGYGQLPPGVLQEYLADPASPTSLGLGQLAGQMSPRAGEILQALSRHAQTRQQALRTP